MKTTHFIIPVCAALGLFAAGRLSMPRTPQPEKQIVVSPSVSPLPLPDQSAVIRNGDVTLQVAGSASLIPSQPAATPSPNH